MGHSIDIDGNTVPISSSVHTGEVLEIADDKHGHADIALKFVENHEGVIYTPEQERAVLRKIDLRLMPLLFFTTFFQFMDKSVMGQSAVYDLLTDLRLVGQDYSWCSSMFYFGYLAGQPLAGICLTYFPMGKFVSFTSLIWGVILFCTPAARDFNGLMGARFFLGVAEAGVTPTYVILCGAWYKKEEIPIRMTIYQCGCGTAIILQSLISYGIGHIHTGIAVWRWFFIIFGIVGLFWATVLFAFMPDTILTANFLNEEEKAIAVERIRRNRTGIANHEFKKNQFIEALLDIRTWYTFFFTIVWIIPTTAVSSFGSLVIKGFGFGTFESSLLNMPLGLTENIGLLGAGYVASKYPNTRCIMQIVTTAPAVLGSCLIYYLPKPNHTGRLIGFYLTNFTNGVWPMLWSLTTSNIAGHTKRTTFTSIMFIAYGAGFIIGPQFFLGSEEPLYPTGFKTMMVCFIIATIMPGFFYVYITWQNKTRAKRLQDIGEANLVIRNEEFYDLTDKEQLQFVYVK